MKLLLYPLLFHILMEVLARAMRHEKKNKKLSTLRYVNICSHKNLQGCSYKHYSYQTKSRNKSNLLIR